MTDFRSKLDFLSDKIMPLFIVELSLAFFVPSLLSILLGVLKTLLSNVDEVD